MTTEKHISIHTNKSVCAVWLFFFFIYFSWKNILASAFSEGSKDWFDLCRLSARNDTLHKVDHVMAAKGNWLLDVWFVMWLFRGETRTYHKSIMTCWYRDWLFSRGTYMHVGTIHFRFLLGIIHNWFERERIFLRYNIDPRLIYY